MFKKSKHYIIFFLMVYFLIIGCVVAAFSEEIVLSSDQTILIFLEQANPVVEIPFDIDISPSLLVDFGSLTDSLIVTLIDPQGQIITSDNAANFNGEYSSYEVQSPDLLLLTPSPLLLEGHHYTYCINNPSSGNWKINITSDNISDDGIAGIATLHTNNNLKVGLLAIGTPYVVDSSIPLVVAVFDGTNPVMDSSVILDDQVFLHREKPSYGIIFAVQNL